MSTPLSAETLIRPNWPAPPAVRACCTTRVGGVSKPPYASLNLGAHVGDEPDNVAANRARLRAAAKLPQAPHWLTQVHQTHSTALPAEADCEADAAYTRQAGEVCAILTADCLPVLFCDRAGTWVAAAHAGWRGLLGGVLESALGSAPPGEILAWLGPAIGPQAFEVGAEVRAAFVAADPEDAAGFVPAERAGHYFANLYRLARLRLARRSVTAVYGGDFCTYQDAARFFSYRRDGVTGRMASLIWLEES